jgi:putative transcriptional regulator
VTDPIDSTRHRLLVSLPDLGDRNFDQTVVYMIEHDDEGALGLVLNRPSETTVAEHVCAAEVSVVEPSVFFVGGPVGVGGMLALGRRQADVELRNARALAGPLVLVDIERLMEDDVDGVDGVRFFTGYSGWGPGQLDAELADGVWNVMDAGPDDVLCAEPEDLWRLVLRRQGGRLASIGLYPEDPNLN